MIVIQAKDYDEMSLKAYEAMKIVLTEKPEAVLGLATGSTPIGLYKCMIADYKAGAVSYKNMTSINLDEYVGLPVTHPECSTTSTSNRKTPTCPTDSPRICKKRRTNTPLSPRRIR